MPASRSRITVLVHSMNAGGAQKRAVSIANCLASCGHEVEFLAVRPEGPVGSELSPGIALAHLQTRRRPRYRLRLLDGVRELQVHLATFRPTVLLAAVTNVHVVATLAAMRVKPRPKIVLRASRHPVRQIPWSRP